MMRKILREIYPIGIFLLVAMAIMAPLYASGFVFLTDMVWGPNLNLADSMRNGIDPGFPIRALFVFLNLLIPAEVLQKIVLTLVLFLPGFTLYRLALRFMPQSLAVSAGMLYMINPHVYDRFMAGHWFVMLGYGFLPIMVLLFLRLLERADWRRFLVFAFAFSIYPILSLHWAYIASGFLLVLWVMQSKVYKVIKLGDQKLVRLKVSKVESEETESRKLENRKWKEFFERGVVFVGIFLVVNSFWIFGFFDDTRTFANIGMGDFEAFATLSDPTFGMFFNVAALYGFWSNDFLQFKDYFSWWWAVPIVVWVFFGLGAWREIRRRNDFALAMVCAFVPALLLSVGYGSALTRPIIDLFYGVVPFFRGLRDTEKISGVLAFAYALLVPFGVLYAISSLGRWFRMGEGMWVRVVSVIVVSIIPFLWAGTLLWGVLARVASHDYPFGWYESKRVLQEDPETRNVLFLPWHAYIRLNFAGYAMVGSPAQAFFSQPMITSNDTDNRFLLESEKSIWDDHVALLKSEVIPDDRDFWKSSDVTHIVVAKTDDWEGFSGIYNSPYFEEVYDSDSMVVFKLKYD